MTAATNPALLVAQATRALAVAGLFDMNGHISVREGDALRINARQASRIAVRPEQVATVRIADGATIMAAVWKEPDARLAARSRSS